MNEKYTHISFVLDHSGSMANIWNDVVGGYESFVLEQQKDTSKATFSLVVFDDLVEVIEDFTPLEKVSPKLTVKPCGCTRLLDAIGQTINQTGIQLAKLLEEERPGKVLIVIQTDGYENSSREFTSAQIKEMVTLQKDTYNWQFIFLGASEACLDIVSNIGLSSVNSTTYSQGSTLMSGFSSKLSSLRSCTLDSYSKVAEISDEDIKNFNA